VDWPRTGLAGIETLALSTIQPDSGLLIGSCDLAQLCLVVLCKLYTSFAWLCSIGCKMYELHTLCWAFSEKLDAVLLTGWRASRQAIEKQ
jgi:hypothetical protein